MSTPQTRNAPTAADQPPSTTPVVTSSAAPGVDHAAVTGIRVQVASRTHAAPMVTLSASRPLEACVGAGADRGQAGEHDDERAGEPDQGRDDPRRHRPQQPAAGGRRSRCRGTGRGGCRDRCGRVRHAAPRRPVGPGRAAAVRTTGPLPGGGPPQAGHGPRRTLAPAPAGVRTVHRPRTPLVLPGRVHATVTCRRAVLVHTGPMDIVVCPECRGSTSSRSAHLQAPSLTARRTWHECVSCGWESPYEDVVHR